MSRRIELLDAAQGPGWRHDAPGLARSPTSPYRGQMGSASNSDPAEWMAQLPPLLESFDYERARELLKQAFPRSHGGLDEARALLELPVGTLDLDSWASEENPRSDTKRLCMARSSSATGNVDKGVASVS